MQPISFRFFAPIFSALFCLGVISGTLLLGGCDSSESDSLLNPPQPDSTLVRVVNLIRDEPINFTLSTLPAVTNLGPFQSSSFSPFFLQEQFPIYLQSFGLTDTLPNQRLSSGVNTTIHTTYLVTGNATARQVITLVTSTSERKDLEIAGNGRIYFVNSVPDSALLLKRGCRAGDTLYRPVKAMASGGSQDLPPGDYALYLFKTDGAEEEASAHLRIEPGKVIFLIAADNGSGLKLYQMEANGTETGPIAEAQAETRTSAELQVLNALDGTIITPYIQGDANPLAPGVLPRTISATTTIVACTDSNGDTLEVITAANDTARLPIRVEVGSRTLAAVYNSQSGTKLLTLNRATFTPEAGTVYVRGVNLSRAGANVSVVVGAGAPAGVDTDLRPFGSLRTGDQSNYVPLPAGLYPISLQQTLNGAFLDGGLQNFATGFYTLLILEENGSPIIYIVRDDMPDTPPRRLEALGRKALFFNMAYGTTARFEASTSAGTVVLENVPYTYVFPTILPTEQITITSPGIGQMAVDLSMEGYTIGATGSPGNYKLISFPVPSSQPEQGKASIRVLNAVPDAGPFDVRISSQGDPIATGLTFGIPSPPTLHDPRRYSFAVTLPANNDTVATIQGVQLSGGRNYLLIIGPKESPTSSSAQYNTLWMQE